MLKKIKEKMADYSSITDVTYYGNVWKEKCYFCGYIDAYFDEEVYKPYIIGTMNNENKLTEYNIGFERGTRDRRIKRDNAPKDLLKEKEEWIKKLAMYDMFAHIETRNLKPDALDMYNFYKGCAINLSSADFVEKYKPKKR